MRKAHRLTASSGNVFRDLGFSTKEAAHLLIRADLLFSFRKRLPHPQCAQR